MLETVHQGSIQESTVPARRPASGAAFGAFAGSAILAAAVVLGATALWVHYGTAIFFEMITSGIAGCF
jgi:hypothetical protein